MPLEVLAFQWHQADQEDPVDSNITFIVNEINICLTAVIMSKQDTVTLKGLEHKALVFIIMSASIFYLCIFICHLFAHNYHHSTCDTSPSVQWFKCDASTSPCEYYMYMVHSQSRKIHVLNKFSL